MIYKENFHPWNKQFKTWKRMYFHNVYVSTLSAVFPSIILLDVARSKPIVRSAVASVSTLGVYPILQNNYFKGTVSVVSSDPQIHNGLPLNP